VDASMSSQMPIYEQGKTYYFKIGDEGNFKIVYIYIDGNSDGIFSPSELLIDSLYYTNDNVDANITIPINSNFTTGIKRVRVITQELGNTANAPHPNMSNACNLGLSVAYDFNCELRAFTTPYSIANEAPTLSTVNNQCYWNRIATTIGASSNTGSFVSFVDSNNNIFGRLYPQANTQLGMVVAHYTKTLNDFTRTGGMRYFGSREVFVNPSIAPTSTYRMRMYIPSNELDSLIANSNGSIASVNDIDIMKDISFCGSSYDPVSQNDTNIILPMPNASYHTPSSYISLGNGNYAMDINGLTSFSTFYFTNKLIGLPLSLLQIKLIGSFNGTSHELSITDLSNITSGRAILQESVDGKNFSDLTIIDLSKKAFTYTQDGNISKVYRVKLMHDQKELYSNAVQLSGVMNETLLYTYPTPTSSIIYASYYTPYVTKVEYQLVDIIGTTQLKGEEKSQTGNNTLEMDMSSLAPGQYILLIKAGNNILRSKVCKH
jgi:hypothetical protein